MSRHLPALLSEIAEVVGEALKDRKAGVEAALKLAQAKGGQRVHIPAQARADHWLAQTLGQRAADAICAHYRVGEEGERGAELDIPLGAGGS